MGQVLSAATARRINGSGNGGNGGGSEGSRNKQESPYRYENVTRVSPIILIVIPMKNTSMIHIKMFHLFLDIRLNLVVLTSQIIL